MDCASPEDYANMKAVVPGAIKAISEELPPEAVQRVRDLLKATGIQENG